MKIAVIMTCFNRKQQTIECLQALFQARDNYDPKMNLHLYLTDDGCTDGTSEEVLNRFPKETITILKGDGNLFWAGGMRFAWREALKKHKEWNYYLLLNDDTSIFPKGFYELMTAHQYCKSHFGKDGVYSGTTCAKSDHSKPTYGGDVYKNRFLGHPKRLHSNGEPQLIDITNANILLIPKSVVDQIGIFYDGYIHGAADSDYAMMAKRKGIPVLITGDFCGACDNDHENFKGLQESILKMNITERKFFFNHPLHSRKDYLTYIRRNIPIKYPMAWIFRMLNIYCPSLYLRLNRMR